MSTVLKRTGANSFTAMLLVKVFPESWGKRTLVMRCLEETGASTVFFVTGDAIASFENLEEQRIYTMQFAGKCVRNSTSSSKFGVKSIFDVHMQWPCKVALSTHIWPLKFPYAFLAWEGLN